MTPFDYVMSINFKKIDYFEQDEVTSQKEYVPFLANRMLSFFVDTILYSNEMNRFPSLEKKLQFQYYINSIERKKRFSKWLKKEGNVDLEVIKKYYGFGDEKALSALSILNPDQLALIKNKIKNSEGGT